MQTSDLGETLEQFGLSPYQASAYVTLVERGSSRATELAEASNVPDARIYDVLRDLDAQGFVELHDRDTLIAHARPPERMRESLLARAKAYSSAAEEIERRWSQPSASEYAVSVVKRFETVLSHTQTAIDNATASVQLSVTPTQFEAVSAHLERAIERGVVVKLTLHTDPNEDESPLEVDALEGRCTEARHRPIPSPFVALVDGKQTFYAPHLAALEKHGLLINDRTHTYVFYWFFRACLWDVWNTVYDERTSGPPVSFVDLRECITMIEPFVTDGATVDVRVVGHERGTEQRVDVRGTVADLEYGGPRQPVAGFDSIARFAGQAAIVVDTGERTFSVGGWGAVIEDVEMTRIVVESIE